ncbi:MAG: 50S ribosome-binding GTPase [Spirochaetes bacterium]|nr:50S ribosome-binding GTPase [Spirochaetota bacterium]
MKRGYSNDKTGPVSYNRRMPTNVTPEYKKAEEAYRRAETADEKIERLEEMIALLPKHKGTEHLYADLKRRLSRLKKDQETSRKKKGRGLALDFTREGAAQVVVIGPPNSGKSSIVSSVTHAHPEIGDYPFTTSRPQPGMMPFEDIQVQLVDTPPVTSDYMHMHLLGLVRHADGVLFVCDLSSDTLLDDAESVFRAFSERHVRFSPERAQDPDRVFCRIVASKSDAAGAGERLRMLAEYLEESEAADLSEPDIIPFSYRNEKEVTAFPPAVVDWLGIVRVYTKIPGGKPELERPYTVFTGETVGDVCALVHKDFSENLKFARLWRGSADPVTVSKNEAVRDGDIVELHM